jgi:excisionase family DNA binding protein
VNQGGDKCIGFSGLRSDEAVADEVLRVLQPEGITAALQAAEEGHKAQTDKRRHTELALEQARYEADRARKQYDAVDPDNRLVAAELEQRWNAQLSEVQRLQSELEALSEPAHVLSSDERQRLLNLGADLRAAWKQPGATEATKKRLLRAVIAEIVAEVDEDVIRLTIHWRGGDHTQLEVKKSRRGHNRYQASAETVDLLRELARLLPDSQIARLLNRLGRRTGQGRTWTESRVRSTRRYYEIPAYVSGERADRGELNLGEAADQLNVSRMSVLRFIRGSQLRARQPCPGAPWIIRKEDLEEFAISGDNDRPVTDDPRQKILGLQ